MVNVCIRREVWCVTLCLEAFDGYPVAWISSFCDAAGILRGREARVVCYFVTRRDDDDDVGMRGR